MYLIAGSLEPEFFSGMYINTMLRQDLAKPGHESKKNRKMSQCSAKDMGGEFCKQAPHLWTLICYERRHGNP